MKRAELVAAVARHRKLTFSYVLFERKSQSYEYSTYNSVEATSEDTVGFIEDVVRSRIGTRYYNQEVEVCVYEV